MTAAGVWAAPAGDGKGDVPSSLGLPEVYDRVAHNLFSINMVWTLLAGFLVMFMQAGFMLVEVGLCRAKNAAHTAAMNFLVYPLGCLAFWAYGFALGWGNWWNGPVPPGWYASLGPGLSLLNSGVGIGAAVDAAGNATGALKYGLMGTKGFFLGSAVGDVSVLTMFFFMMVFMDTTATIPKVVLGTFILAFGWFGFNPGSTLAGTDLRISYVVVNTMLAGITGAIGAMIVLEAKGLKHDPSMLCNGMLAGLVAITAPCAFVDP